ncbi:hypothetical protein [Pseudozobellia sp. WGM2]|uniref:hypothetical protein n=1 Tax=Pseudozobellia sp. WGM2 TaxID=2787625 RepID=UPI001ADFD278|nr:hypothetical protein [Pseudozobellia sp. WGM2]
MEIKNIKYSNKEYIENGNFEEGKPLISYLGLSSEGGFISHPLINDIQGVSWEYQKENGDLNKVEIFEKENNLFAYPSPNMKYMVVLFDRKSEYHTHPNNLVVFYANGEEKQVISVPELISDQARKNALNPFGEDKEGSFENIWWYKKENEKKMAVDIHFAWDNTETREFDPETGQFGNVIGVSGRF